MYDPATKKSFSAFNGKSMNVSVLDAVTEKVIGHLVLSGKPEFAATDGNGTVYVNIEDKSMLVSIDSNKLNRSKRAGPWPLAKNRRL